MTTTASLRYIKVLGGTNSTNGNLTGYVQDLQVWNKRNAD